MSLQSIEDLTLTITLEMRVRASLDATFAALLEQVGPGNETHEGKPLPLTLEAWPGGRWFRNLGEGEGHFYRLSAVDDGTLVSFRHTALGFMQEGHRFHVGEGWQRTLDRTRQQAEAATLQPEAAIQ